MKLHKKKKFTLKSVKNFLKKLIIMGKKIFVACDTNSINEVKKIIINTRTRKLKIGYKFGLEFINSKNGTSFISKLKSTSLLYPGAQIPL